VGIQLVEIGAKVLNQRTILSKLLSVVIYFKKGADMSEQIVSNRVLNRMGARELTSEEVQHVAGGTTGCHGTSLHKNGPIVDVLCDPS
jgi:hypothetical protein